MRSRMKKTGLFLVFAFVLSMFAVFDISADFNSSLDTVLSEKNLTYGSASYVLLSGAGEIDENASFAEAARVMSEKASVTGISWDEEISLGMYSHLVMQTYGISGGIFYRIFPGPRYALRELRFRRIIQGRSYTGMSLSGESALRILNRVLEKGEE